jgi:putative FmdB family regulatory protein
MPLYTYRCNNCDHLFEARQRMSDDPLSDCPACEGEVRRVINSVGVVFKGNGFYITDSRNGRSLNGASSTNGNGVSGDKTKLTETDKNAKSENKTKPQAATPKADTKTAVAASA